MKTKQVWLYGLGIVSAIAVAGILILSAKVSSLNDSLASANERASEAEDDRDEAVDNLEEELDDLEEELSDTKKSLRNARATPPAPPGDLQEQLENGTAVPVDGLSASLPREFWTCTRYVRGDCHSLRDDVVFKNETQVGSAVTCLFDITFEDGATTTFTWSSSFVPPGGGTDTGVLYFYSDYSSPIDTLGTPDDCYRGVARYSSGIGD